VCMFDFFKNIRRYVRSKDACLLYMVIAIVIILSCVCFVIGKFLGINKELATIIVLFATLMAIIIYTWKTWQYKDLVCEQILLDIRPLVIFECYHRTIRNVGKGIAKGIWIEKIPINCFRLLGIENSEAKFVIFDKVGCLADKDSSPYLKFNLFDEKGTKITDPNISALIARTLDDTGNSLEKLKVVIGYYDLKNNVYRTHMKNINGVFQVDHIV